MAKGVKSFEEAVEEYIMAGHSVFELAYGKTGLDLMSVQEAVEMIGREKDLPELIGELRIRYNFRMGIKN